MVIKNNAKLEEELTCRFKIDIGIWHILTQALKSIKILRFNGLLVTKVYNVWAKKVQRSYFSWYCRVKQIWRKTDLWFEKWHEKFSKFSPKHLKVSKLGLWWDPFAQSRKCMSLKFTEELCDMTMKSSAKFKEELTCHFKIDMRNLTILSRAFENLKNLLFNWLLWPKYMCQLKKVQRSYVWWHWRLMQTLKENWLVLSKMTWGIWKICIGWNKSALSNCAPTHSRPLQATPTHSRPFQPTPINYRPLQPTPGHSNPLS